MMSWQLLQGEFYLVGRLQRKENFLSGVLLGLLAVAWGVLLLPRLFRGSEGGFDVFGVFRALGAIVPSRRTSRDPMAALSRLSAGTTSPLASSRSLAIGSPVQGVARSRRTHKRRRDVFMGLLFSAIGTAVLSLVPGFSMLWKANIVVDILLASYVGLLISARRPGDAAARRSALGTNYGYSAPDPRLNYARSNG